MCCCQTLREHYNEFDRHLKSIRITMLAEEQFETSSAICLSSEDIAAVLTNVGRREASYAHTVESQTAGLLRGLFGCKGTTWLASIKRPAPRESVEPSYGDADRFLHRLGGGIFTFQTFPERDRRGKGWVGHGTLSALEKALRRHDAAGKAVTVMVNAGDLKGRKAENVREVRALYVDLDGSPIDPVQDAALKPHMIIETSPRRFHAYWCVTGVSLDEFSDFQRQLADQFNGDPSVCDLPRCMRVPGFTHNKGEPSNRALLAAMMTARRTRAPRCSRLSICELRSASRPR